MESCARILSPTHFPSVFPLPNLNRRNFNPVWPRKPEASKSLRLHCHKMYVPGGFSLSISFCLSISYTQILFVL